MQQPTKQFLLFFGKSIIIICSVSVVSLNNFLISFSFRSRFFLLFIT